MSNNSVIVIQVKNQQYVLLDSPHYIMFHQLVIKAVPVLMFLDEKQSNHAKVNMPDLQNFKIEELLNVLPIDIESLTKGPEILEELQPNLMAEKIIIHAVVLYWLSVQLKKSNSEENSIEAKIFLKKSWKICRNFLPADCLIYKNIESMWEKTKNSGVNRVRSISRIKPKGKELKSEGRSASSNKIRSSPLKKLNDTNKDITERKSEQNLMPLRKRIIGKFKKMKVK